MYLANYPATATSGNSVAKYMELFSVAAILIFIQLFSQFYPAQ